MVAKRRRLRIIVASAAFEAVAHRSLSDVAQHSAMNNYTAGWVTCHAAGPSGAIAGVKHRCWIYQDGRTYWSICEVVEAFLADSGASWWAEVKRMRPQWEAVFGRLQFSIELEMQMSMRQALHLGIGGGTSSCVRDFALGPAGILLGGVAVPPPPPPPT